MVVLIYRAAHCAQRIVTVGQHVRHTELLHVAHARRLDYIDISDVMRQHAVEADFEVFHIAAGVVLLQSAIRYSALTPFGLIGLSGHQLPIHQAHGLHLTIDHAYSSRICTFALSKGPCPRRSQAYAKAALQTANRPFKAYQPHLSVYVPVNVNPAQAFRQVAAELSPVNFHSNLHIAACGPSL